MHHIRSIQVDGFRGQPKPIKFQLNERANFLIGKNGTGKTTLINLIASILSFDTTAIETTSFEKVIITLSSESSRRQPQIIVTAIERGRGGYEYHLKLHSRDQGLSARFGEREVFWRSAHERNFDNMVTLRGPDYEIAGQIRNLLSQLFSINWLALNRSTQSGNFGVDEDEEYEFDHIDEKIKEVNAKLAGYFSRLDREISVRNTDFQRSWFLSFLSTESAATPSRITELDEDQEKVALDKIFRLFALPENMFKRRLDRHFSAFKKAKKNFSEQKRLYLDDYLAMSDTYRLHKLIEGWYKLQVNQQEIYEPKTEFTDKISTLFFKKSISVNNSNRLVVLNDAAQEIDLSSLSSGEKQMIIFLGETLLQESNSHIFLADEPELSLHVEWQETLVENILSLNPNAQVFFATHSPDIVSSFGKGVIDMEDLL